MNILTTLHAYFLVLRYRLQQWRDKEMTGYIRRLQIMSSAETVRYIMSHRCSCARFGDGEFAVMEGGGNGFQHPDAKLGERLKEVIASDNPNLLVCIPLSLKKTRSLVLNSQLSALGYRHCFLKKVIMPVVRYSRNYGDALFTRFYMMRKNKAHTAEYVDLLKQLWAGEDLLIVEGKYSRLGVGNDLFDNAKSIKRILCPSKDAFTSYDAILQHTVSATDGRLVVLALGMTATVLAYDLANRGIRAFDLGHIDVEYEWFRMGAKRKVAIPGKQVEEVEGGQSQISSTDKTYLSQIIASIGE